MLLAELEKFIVFWIGPRQEQFGEPTAVLNAYQLPEPLRRLYEFAGCWSRPSTDAEGDLPIFSICDHLRSVDQLVWTPEGKLIFLDENQGNWTCATLSEGDDPPVWVEDVVDLHRQGNWRLVTESLSRFLVTFCLRELLFGSQLLLCDKLLERSFESSKDSVIPLWTGGPNANWDGNSSFFLVHDSVLIGDIGGARWFASNHEKGIGFLNAHQGPIREVGLEIESSWSLSFRTDGSASITLPGQFDATALTPPGSFDFASVRDQLKSVCTDVMPRSNRWYATFSRSGQTSCRGTGVQDARIAEALFREVLNALVSTETQFDKLMQKYPPQF